MNKLQGKIAVITGASGGMGREISSRLANAGVRLALASNDARGLEEIELPGEHFTSVIDVRNENEVGALFEETKRRFGAPDILLNLAGLSIPAKLWEMSEEDFDTTMDVNLKGTFFASKHFALTADPEKGGIIVSIGSMAAKRANGNAPLYCTAKASVNMLAAGMAIQLKERGIRVTTLNPGGADTPFWGSRKVDRSKLLKPSDIADVIMFVLSCDSRVAISEIDFESFYNL